jgi:alanyl-tRNA synthetase
MSVGQVVQAQVNQERRLATATHHTATHVLHAALRAKFGDKVQQKGSLVTPERLRFDFSFERPLTHDELVELETFLDTVFKNMIRRNTGLC